MHPLEPCEVCGYFVAGQGQTQRHHRDGNRLNNARENIAFLCRKHHSDAHRALDGRVGGGPRPRITEMHRRAAVERTRRAIRLMEDGHTLPLAATAIGVTPHSLRRCLRKYGRAA